MSNHVPVLLKEALGFLNIRPGARFIDATVGGGGHSEAILERGGVVLGIDQDPTAIEIAQKRLSACSGRYTVPPRDAFSPPSPPLRQGYVGLRRDLRSRGSESEDSGVYTRSFKLVQGNFSSLQNIASATGFGKVDGILFDLGFASFQVDDPSRGLSFSKEGPLDMRLDPNLAVTAADLVNVLPESQLRELLEEVEEPKAQALARAIVKARQGNKLSTTDQLKRLVETVYGPRETGKIHPATRTFMALRIAVNTEFENLRQALPQAVDLLSSKGRLVVISFHSGEDRIVKKFFNSTEGLEILTDRPVRPSTEEIGENPRARSARLRAAQKI